jgi:hypothetical protein
MDILIEQFKKVSTFFILLILLYIVAVFSNLFFQWEGISIIVRVYLFIFSFQLVFIFSQVDLDYYRGVYRGRYGKNSELLLFFHTRIIPLLIIYGAIVILTFIFYLKNENWPMRPFLNVFTGRFSNIIIYSLILMIILKIEKSLKGTIPLFFFFGVTYFIIYSIVYSLYPDGYPTSILKVLNFTIVFFSLFFEFFYKRIKLLKLFFLTIILSLLFHSMVVGIYYSFYRFSKEGSYSQVESSLFLLHMGYSFPLKKLNKVMGSKSDSTLIPDIIHFSEKYKADIKLSREEWDRLFLDGDLVMGKALSEYFLKNNIKVSFESINRLAARHSVLSGKKFVNCKSIIKYAAKNFPEKRERFFFHYKTENIFYKKWVFKVIKEAGDIESVPWLLEKLTDIDREISLAAYEVLKKITGEDPAGELKVKENNPDVIIHFRKWFQQQGSTT